MNSGKCQNEALQIEPFDMVLTKAYFWLTTIDLLRRTWFLHKDLFLEMSRKNVCTVLRSSKVSISTKFIMYKTTRNFKKCIQDVICYVSLMKLRWYEIWFSIVLKTCYLIKWNLFYIKTILKEIVIKSVSVRFFSVNGEISAILPDSRFWYHT